MTNPNDIYYVVQVNGRAVTSPVASQHLAESKLIQLDPEQQQIAEIVPVTADGRQILFD